MVSAESTDIDMDIGDQEGGAELGNVPSDQNVCMDDQSGQR